MIDREVGGHSYLIVRDEFLGFVEDELLRKHLPTMFSLIKNESWGIEDDQIPSCSQPLTMPTRDWGVVGFMTPSASYEKSKFLGSGESMVARLKLARALH